jgi:thiol-disulfide isomerase/thioredoxin
MNSSDSAQSVSINKRAKWLIYLRDFALLVVALSAIVYWQTKDMLSADGTVNIPQQNLVSLDGEVLPLLSNDKANLVYFFAPWCTICSLSIGNLDYLDPEKINVVVIALDYSSKEEVDKFVSEHDVKSRVFMGHDALKAQFKIQGYPSYYLVDEKGLITSRAFGYSSAVGLKLREAFGA